MTSTKSLKRERKVVLVNDTTNDEIFGADDITYITDGPHGVLNGDLVILEATDQMCPCCDKYLWKIVQ
jgi:hypothetical protein